LHQQNQRLARPKSEGVQLGQRAAIYARVSTSDQSCERQISELTAFAERGGYDVVGVFKETASGASANRIARNRVLDLAQARHIDAILVSELSRWGRSTQDLLDTLNRLAGWKVSVVAMSGMTFEVETPHGRMMATMLAGIAQFERDLLSERVKSGLAAARARGKKLGRQPGQRPKADKLTPKVIQAVAEGRSYRWIARDLGISKNTVTDIIRRHRQNALLYDPAPYRNLPHCPQRNAQTTDFVSHCEYGIIILSSSRNTLTRAYYSAPDPLRTYGVEYRIR